MRGHATLHTTRGRHWYSSTSHRRYTDFARAMIPRDIFIPGAYAGPTRPTGLSHSLGKQAKHTKFDNFAERITFAEHWKLVAESSEFQLTLSRAA